ncbi:MAG: hypothetical protein Sapg2KO_32010 [Saprospiraceae bacterium]
MFNRHLRAFGLAPALAYPLSLILFVGLSFYVFYKTQYAVYIYPVLALSLIGSLSEKERNVFLQHIFSKQHYQRLRILENLLVALPFALFLMLKLAFLEALGFIALSVLLAFIKSGSSNNYSLPTPFYRYPFEFTVGFRKTFLFLLLIYFVAVMGFWVDNFNLSVFTLILVFATTLTFYMVPEAPFYVWIFAQKPSSFLKHKLGVAVMYANLLALPIAIAALILYPSFGWVILLAHLVGSLFLVALILAKYADFPKEIGLPAIIFLVMAIPFPPILLLLIPYFYKKAIRRLNQFLA